MGEDNVCHVNWDIVPGGRSSRAVLSLELFFQPRIRLKIMLPCLYIRPAEITFCVLSGKK